MRRASAGTGLAKTYAPGHGSGNEGLAGVLTVYILEAEKIPLPEQSVTLRPYAKLTLLGDEEVVHTTGLAVGSYMQLWRDEKCEFSLKTPSVVKVELFHKGPDGGEHAPLGETSIKIESKTDCGQKWLPLINGEGADTGGQVKLRWDFQAKPVGAPTTTVAPAATFRRPTPSFTETVNSVGGMGIAEGAMGKLKLEIIRAKGLTTPQYWISFSPYIICKYQGETHETKVQKNTTNPFYNHKAEFDVKEREPIIFTLMDANLTTATPDDPPPTPREYGCVGWDFDPETPIKPSVVTLQILKNLDDIEPPDDMGVLELRITYKPAKKGSQPEGGRKDSVTENGLIHLNYQPTINGSVSIVPQDCQYIWFNMYDDAKFKMVVEQKIIEAYLAEHIKAASPGRVRPRLSGTTSAGVPITMDSVVANGWGCVRMMHVVDMVRLCAERVAKGEALPIPESEVHGLRVKLAEMAIMRRQVISSSAEVANALKSLWVLFTTGTAKPSTTPEDEDFTEVHHKALTTHFLLTFTPGLSYSLASSIASTEWADVGQSGRDTSGTLLLKEERFNFLVTGMAALWCDTLTEYEIQQFLTVITPVILEARKSVLKLKKRRSKARVVHDGFKKPDHLDELGHRLPKNSNGVRRSSNATTTPPAGGAGRRKSSKSGGVPTPTRPGSSKARVSKPPQHPTNDKEKHNQKDEKEKQEEQLETSDHYETILRSYRKGSADSFGSYGELTKAGDLRNSVDLSKSVTSEFSKSKRRKSSKKLSHSSSMKKARKRSAFMIAEERVKHAFEMEDMDWSVVNKWANEVFGGFQGGGMEDVLKMGHSEVDMVLLRLFPNELSKKHPKVRGDLVASVVTFFQAIRPKEPAPAEQQGNQVGQSKIPEGCLKVMLGYCTVPVLKKLVVASKATRALAEGLMMERVERVYPLVGEGDLENALKAVFTPVACDELRHQVGLGKLKAPPRLAQVVAEMACTLLSIETNGYWAKFREVICNPHSYSHFQDYSPASLTSTVFKACLKIKEDTDSGIDRQGRQLDESMRGVSWVTLTEETLTASSPGPLVLLYKWIKLLMMTYSRHAGRTYYYVNTYGWMHKAPYELYWD